PCRIWLHEADSLTAASEASLESFASPVLTELVPPLLGAILHDVPFSLPFQTPPLRLVLALVTAVLASQPAGLSSHAADVGHMLAILTYDLAPLTSCNPGFLRSELMRRAQFVGRLPPLARNLTLLVGVHRGEAPIARTCHFVHLSGLGLRSPGYPFLPRYRKRYPGLRVLRVRKHCRNTQLIYPNKQAPRIHAGK